MYNIINLDTSNTQISRRTRPPIRIKGKEYSQYVLINRKSYGYLQGLYGFFGNNRSIVDLNKICAVNSPRTSKVTWNSLKTIMTLQSLMIQFPGDQKISNFTCHSSHPFQGEH